MFLDASLLEKFKEAVSQRSEHVTGFLDFCAAISSTKPQFVEDWTKAVRKWEDDNTKTNPFAVTKAGTLSFLMFFCLAVVYMSSGTITPNAVRLRLAEEDKAALLNNTAEFAHKDISASELLCQGIEIEDQQCVSVSFIC